MQEVCVCCWRIALSHLFFLHTPCCVLHFSRHMCIPCVGLQTELLLTSILSCWLQRGAGIAKAIFCPLLPEEDAEHFPMHPSGASEEQGNPTTSSSSRRRQQEGLKNPCLPPGVTAADLASDTWWRHVPSQWRRKCSSRGHQDYVYTPAWEELQPGHPQFTLGAALLWYRSLAGEPAVIRGAQVKCRVKGGGFWDEGEESVAGSIQRTTLGFAAVVVGGVVCCSRLCA